MSGNVIYLGLNSNSRRSAMSGSPSRRYFRPKCPSWLRSREILSPISRRRTERNFALVMGNRPRMRCEGETRPTRSCSDLPHPGTSLIVMDRRASTSQTLAKVLPFVANILGWESGSSAGSWFWLVVHRSRDCLIRYRPVTAFASSAACFFLLARKKKAFRPRC